MPLKRAQNRGILADFRPYFGPFSEGCRTPPHPSDDPPTLKNESWVPLIYVKMIRETQHAILSRFEVICDFRPKMAKNDKNPKRFKKRPFSAPPRADMIGGLRANGGGCSSHPKSCPWNYSKF